MPLYPDPYMINPYLLQQGPLPQTLGESLAMKEIHRLETDVSNLKNANYEIEQIKRDRDNWKKRYNAAREVVADAIIAAPETTREKRLNAADKRIEKKLEETKQ